MAIKMMLYKTHEILILTLSVTSVTAMRLVGRGAKNYYGAP